MYIPMSIAILAPLLVGWLGLHALASSVPPTLTALERQIEFQRGVLLTTRTLTPGASEGRRLQVKANVSVEALFVLGVPSALQLRAKNKLESDGGQILHPVPDKNGEPMWLVRAAPEVVEMLLEDFPSTTAAAFPPEFKIAPQLEQLLTRMNATKPSSWLALLKDKSLTVKMPDGATYVVLLVLTPSVLTAQLQNLTASLPKQSSCPLKVEPFSIGQFVKVTLCPQALRNVTRWLSRHPAVTYLELAAPQRAANLHAGAVLQSSQRMQTTPPPELRAGINSSFFPLWKAGLDGRDQVVGVVDSGLDMDSCYFWDPQFKNYQSLKVTAPFFQNISMFASPSHRKVVAYAFYADAIDGNGHGTHVAATIVGSAFNYSATSQPDLATGIAPGARLAFLDVGTGPDSDLSIPRDPTTLYSFMRLAGARIMSNSWTQPTGDGASYFSVTCSLFDQFVWDKQDTLLVFAAGNDGEDPWALSTTGTTAAPGSCKNVLSVGATENWVDRGLEEIPQKLLLPNNTRANISTASYVGPWNFGTLNFTYFRTSYAVKSKDVGWTVLQGMDSRFASWVKGYQLVMADPPDACEPLTRRYTPFERVIVLVRKTSGYCLARYSAQNVANSGAAGAIIYWDDIEWPRFAASGGLNIKNGKFPVAIIKANAGRRLDSILSVKIPVNVTWTPQTGIAPLPHEQVALFSSYGAEVNPEAVDPRVKPDLAAPGLLLSAYSDGKYNGRMDQCSTVVMEGTSMSAPVVSGAAALVRQYLMEGWYPTGMPVNINQYTPSSALVKAILIGGASGLKGVSRSTNKRLKGPPSPFQGFGRVDLSKALPVRGDPTAWGIQLLDKALFNNSKQIHTYTFNVSKATAKAGRPLIVALVWHDPPGFAGGANRVLVNNLDLIVEGPLSGGSKPRKTYWGNDVQGGDVYNNVEKVRVPSAGAGQWVITIRAQYIYILSAPQRYSMAVLGAVDTSIRSDYNPAWAPKG